MGENLTFSFFLRPLLSNILEWVPECWWQKRLPAGLDSMTVAGGTSTKTGGLSFSSSTSKLRSILPSATLPLLNKANPVSCWTEINTHTCWYVLRSQFTRFLQVHIGAEHRWRNSSGLNFSKSNKTYTNSDNGFRSVHMPLPLTTLAVLCITGKCL